MTPCIDQASMVLTDDYCLLARNTVSRGTNKPKFLYKTYNSSLQGREDGAITLEYCSVSSRITWCQVTEDSSQFKYTRPTLLVARRDSVVLHAEIKS